MKNLCHRYIFFKKIGIDMTIGRLGHTLFLNMYVSYSIYLYVNIYLIYIYYSG